jgi:hypothetical protein
MLLLVLVFELRNLIGDYGVFTLMRVCWRHACPYNALPFFVLTAVSAAGTIMSRSMSKSKYPDFHKTLASVGAPFTIHQSPFTGS